VYDYITKLCRAQAEIILTHVNPNVRGLRYNATSRKAAGSIPDEVIGFFNSPNLSNRVMALWLTQRLTEMSTRNLPGGKDAAGEYG
jgi:hypothetical protein